MRSIDTKPSITTGESNIKATQLYCIFMRINICFAFFRGYKIQKHSISKKHPCDKIFAPNAVPICINAMMNKSDELNLTEYLIWLPLISQILKKVKITHWQPILR